MTGPTTWVNSWAVLIVQWFEKVFHRWDYCFSHPPFMNISVTMPDVSVFEAFI